MCAQAANVLSADVTECKQSRTVSVTERTLESTKQATVRQTAKEASCAQNNIALDDQQKYLTAIELPAGL